ncbi:MAG: hypothetical protein H7320_15265 [Ferruginibacter sp.]|nr:hypothetical protein [Ferruginibacter sp.]
MTLYQYNDLDELEQHETLWEHGVMIGERVEGEYKLILYQIFTFYIELYYHIENNVLHRLRTFSNTELLKDYINQFSLKELE